jgi:hypothetical protein
MFRRDVFSRDDLRGQLPAQGSMFGIPRDKGGVGCVLAVGDVLELMVPTVTPRRASRYQARASSRRLRARQALVIAWRVARLFRRF